MAQGMQRRLGGLPRFLQRQHGLEGIDVPKHLLEVNGEPILARTIRLVQELTSQWTIWEKPIIHVVGWPEHAAAAPPYGLITLDEPGQCVLDGIAQTRKFWGSGRVLVLLGDVVFSRAALRSILWDRSPLFWAGGLVHSDGSHKSGRAEIFGMGLGACMQDFVSFLLDDAPCRAPGRTGYAGGHLRRLLWEAHRIIVMKATRSTEQYHPWAPQQAPNGPLFRLIDDWTDDIDTFEDVAKLEDFSRWAKAEEQC